MRESVVLPAPEGEDRTSISPRRAMAPLPEPVLAAGLFTIVRYPKKRSKQCSKKCSKKVSRRNVPRNVPDLSAAGGANLFQILHLLAELLDHVLELEADIGERHVVRL